MQLCCTTRFAARKLQKPKKIDKGVGSPHPTQRASVGMEASSQISDTTGYYPFDEAGKAHLPLSLYIFSSRRCAVGFQFLILEDEPTGNLDSLTGVEVMELLAGFKRERITVFMVTHNNE